MDIPHRVVSSNYIFNQILLSKDRWRILAILRKRLKDISQEVKLSEMKDD